MSTLAWVWGENVTIGLLKSVPFYTSTRWYNQNLGIQNVSHYKIRVHRKLLRSPPWQWDQRRLTGGVTAILYFPRALKDLLRWGPSTVGLPQTAQKGALSKTLWQLQGSPCWGHAVQTDPHRARGRMPNSGEGERPTSADQPRIRWSSGFYAQPQPPPFDLVSAGGSAAVAVLKQKTDDRKTYCPLAVRSTGQV